MLLRRPGYEVDIDAILIACAEHGVAIEINANPHRLDLDWRWHRRALELGCMFSINPDAHSIDELDLTRWGVLVARKGGIPPERVLNSLDLKEITALLQARRVSVPIIRDGGIREDLSFPLRPQRNALRFDFHRELPAGRSTDWTRAKWFGPRMSGPGSDHWLASLAPQPPGLRRLGPHSAHAAFEIDGRNDARPRRPALDAEQ